MLFIYALTAFGAVEGVEMGKLAVSHQGARARGLDEREVEKLRKIQMKGQRGVRPRKNKFGNPDETHADLKHRKVYDNILAGSWLQCEKN